jgi:hypothetical protein
MTNVRRAELISLRSKIQHNNAIYAIALGEGDYADLHKSFEIRLQNNELALDAINNTLTADTVIRRFYAAVRKAGYRVTPEIAGEFAGLINCDDILEFAAKGDLSIRMEIDHWFDTDETSSIMGGIAQCVPDAA